MAVKPGGVSMELEQKEMEKLERLQRWAKSNARRSFLYTLITYLGLAFVYFIIAFVLGWVSWKELGWIVFILMAVVVWCKAVYDSEANIRFLLRIVEKQQKMD
jgi:hypothetical protein